MAPHEEDEEETFWAAKRERAENGGEVNHPLLLSTTQHSIHKMNAIHSLVPLSKEVTWLSEERDDMNVPTYGHAYLRDRLGAMENNMGKLVYPRTYHEVISSNAVQC